MFYNDNHMFVYAGFINHLTGYKKPTMLVRQNKNNNINHVLTFCCKYFFQQQVNRGKSNIM